MYTTIDKVKLWLGISEDRFDGELNDLIYSASSELDVKLKALGIYPMPDEISDAISDALAEYCAGIFRARRSNDFTMVKHAEERLENILSAYSRYFGKVKA